MTEEGIRGRAAGPRGLLVNVLLAALSALLFGVSLAFDLTRPLEVTVLFAFALAVVLLSVLAGFSVSWTLRHRGTRREDEGPID